MDVLFVRGVADVWIFVRGLAMGVEEPGVFTVTCDTCGKTEEMAATVYADNTFGVDDSTIREEGWTGDSEECYCPECSEEGDE